MNGEHIVEVFHVAERVIYGVAPALITAFFFVRIFCYDLRKTVIVIVEVGKNIFLVFRGTVTESKEEQGVEDRVL